LGARGWCEIARIEARVLGRADGVVIARIEARVLWRVEFGCARSRRVRSATDREGSCDSWI
jgi:hypothetical protein